MIMIHLLNLLLAERRPVTIEREEEDTTVLVVTHSTQPQSISSSNFLFTIPRISCCMIASVMSILVFIGGLELEKSAKQKQDPVQTFWSTIYYCVSYMCFH